MPGQGWLRVENAPATLREAIPGNPTEYREHVKRCLVLAGEASSPLAKAQLEHLAQIWMDLADVIDRTGRFSRTGQ